MKLFRPLALTGFLMPVLACAHPGHDGHELTWDFTAGTNHPLSGLDHLLALVAVGLWASQLGGRSRWLLPATFVTLMAFGAALAQAGWACPGLESGLAASLLVLGLLIASAARLPVAAGMAVVGGFAVLHGLAHGLEMPASAGGLAYGLGFSVTTVLLHASGLGLGSCCIKHRPKAARVAGLIVAGAGMLAFAV